MIGFVRKEIQQKVLGNMQIQKIQPVTVNQTTFGKRRVDNETRLQTTTERMSKLVKGDQYVDDSDKDPKLEKAQALLETLTEDTGDEDAKPSPLKAVGVTALTALVAFAPSKLTSTKLIRGGLDSLLQNAPETIGRRFSDIAQGAKGFVTRHFAQMDTSKPHGEFFRSILMGNEAKGTKGAMAMFADYAQKGAAKLKITETNPDAGALANLISKVTSTGIGLTTSTLAIKGATADKDKNGSPDMLEKQAQRDKKASRALDTVNKLLDVAEIVGSAA